MSPAPPKAPVVEWFPLWVPLHAALHRGMGLPALDSEEGAALYPRVRSIFVRNGLMDRDVALAASERLVEVEHKLSQHWRLLLEQAKAIYRERAQTGGGGAADSREAAELASRGCDDCLGMGLAHRFRRSSESPAGALIVLYCTCPMGRWIKAQHERKAPDIRKRIWDLGSLPWLQGVEYRLPPELLTQLAGDPGWGERLRADHEDKKLPGADRWLSWAFDPTRAHSPF